MPTSIDDIVRMYTLASDRSHGDREGRSLVCAELAQRAGASQQLIAAALLHDIGDLLPGAQPRTLELQALTAATYLQEWFGHGVTEPIRLQVEALRYLCTVDGRYQKAASRTARQCFADHGGPLTPSQLATFLQKPFADDAIALRCWADLADRRPMAIVGWEHFRPVLDQARKRVLEETT